MEKGKTLQMDHLLCVKDIWICWRKVFSRYPESVVTKRTLLLESEESLKCWVFDEIHWPQQLSNLLAAVWEGQPWSFFYFLLSATWR